MKSKFLILGLIASVFSTAFVFSEEESLKAAPCVHCNCEKEGVVEEEIKSSAVIKEEDASKEVTCEKCDQSEEEVKKVSFS